MAACSAPSASCTAATESAGRSDATADVTPTPPAAPRTPRRPSRRAPRGTAAASPRAPRPAARRPSAPCSTRSPDRPAAPSRAARSRTTRSAAAPGRPPPATPPRARSWRSRSPKPGSRATGRSTRSPWRPPRPPARSPRVRPAGRVAGVARGWCRRPAPGGTTLSPPRVAAPHGAKPSQLVILPFAENTRSDAPCLLAASAPPGTRYAWQPRSVKEGRINDTAGSAHVPGQRQRTIGTSETLEPVVAAAVGKAGFELETLQVQQAGRRQLVKVVVDSRMDTEGTGIGLDEIAEVSRAVSAALDELE